MGLLTSHNCLLVNDQVGSVWSFSDGSLPVPPGATWMSPRFSDSAWLSGTFSD